MSLTISKAKTKGDDEYIQKIFPKFFNRDRFPKVRKQAEDGSVEIYIAKKGGRKVGFVIWHETSNNWVYVDFIAAVGYGEELIKKLHNMWHKHGYKGVNLDTFIYDGELPRLASVRRLNYFYKMGYIADVIDHPSPGHVMFHMTYKFKHDSKDLYESKNTLGGNKDHETDKGSRISNFPRSY